MNIVSCQVAFVKRKFNNIQKNVIVGAIHELPLHLLPSDKSSRVR
ncbi:MAG: hypothetical protein O9338_06385 [Microcystis sp. LE19-251.1A]|nr:hypothetical protein [Microcystis sp. LE19-41.2A]MCZ8047737.1 hypothetical protein [Microcystis sp. LE19-41.2A]MCZ8362405.1 hypothetical protein [Microcystis sp. LE19-251.1A]